MRANRWQFAALGRPTEVMSWHAEDLPEPGPGQALVKIRAVGINRSDLNYVLGSHFPARRFPSGLGGEAVGEILALGPPASDGPPPVRGLQLAVGGRVGTVSGRIDRIASGVYRDIGLYDQAALLPVPLDYTDEEGAALWTAVFTMAGAMEMAGFNAHSAPGKTVLFTAGASGMGAFGLRLARHWGARTIATTRRQDKAGALAELADEIIVCSDSASLAKGVLACTDGRGYDLALDPVGAAFYPGLIEAAARSGRIVSYECISGSPANISIMEMIMKDLSLHGFTTFRVFGDPHRLDAMVELGMEHAQAVRPLVANTFPLSEAAEALETLEQSRHIGKLVLRA